jgi:hypothetical protein
VAASALRHREQQTVIAVAGSTATDPLVAGDPLASQWPVPMTVVVIPRIWPGPTTLHCPGVRSVKRDPASEHVAVVNEVTAASEHDTPEGPPHPQLPSAQPRVSMMPE